MEKFHNLPLEKQSTIINAALEAFGSNGYKKASVNDIATAAGISKAMVFHYFGTKKDLYYYLLDFCSDLITNEINSNFDSRITDFFARILMATELKFAVIKKHPAILSFLYSAYNEKNEEAKEGFDSLMARSDAFRSKIAYEGMDVTKFKEGVDIQLVMKMLILIGEGLFSPTGSLQEADLDVKMKDFEDCLQLLRSNLYKEQFLK